MADEHGRTGTGDSGPGERGPIDLRVGRRRLLQSGVAAAGLALAGCSGGGGDDGSDGDDGGGSDGTDGTDGGDGSAGSDDGDDGDRPPGADVVGGPNDLQSRVDVRATVLESDQGAGTHVFTPAVAWVELGATVVWSFEEAFHTVTVYHPQYDRPMRVPNGVETPFNSEFGGAGDPGTSFNFVFETPGVWNYFCKPHEGMGMVGLVVVDGPRAEGGVVRPDDVESEAAAEKLTRLLKTGGIVE